MKPPIILPSSCKVDLLLHREILRMRAAYQLSLDEFRGLYISYQQVDGLVEQTRETQGFSSAPIVELTERAADLQATACVMRSAQSPWARLSVEFSLSPEEQDILFLAFAPEIDLKYETLYAYLNNNITRKFPTVELALRVLSTSSVERARLRGLLLPQSALFAENLLKTIESVPLTSSLGEGFSLTPSVARYLLGFGCGEESPRIITRKQTNFRNPPRLVDPSDGPLDGWERVPLTNGELCRLRGVVKFFTTESNGRSAPCLVFEGRSGAGRSKAASAVCAELGLDLLAIDLEAIRNASESLSKLIDAAILQSRLEPAGLYLTGLESLFSGEGKPMLECHAIAAAMIRCRHPVFLACAPGTPWREFLRRGAALCFRFPDPEYSMRLNLCVMRSKSMKCRFPKTISMHWREGSC